MRRPSQSFGWNPKEEEKDNTSESEYVVFRVLKLVVDEVSERADEPKDRML